AVVARVDAPGRIDGETEHPAAGRAEQAHGAVEGHPVELASLASGIDVAVHGIPDDALGVVEPVGKDRQVVGGDHPRGRFGPLITPAEATVPFAPLTPPPGCVPAPQRYSDAIGVRYPRDPRTGRRKNSWSGDMSPCMWWPPVSPSRRSRSSGVRISRCR